MSTYLFRFCTPKEQPEGSPEAVLLVAESEAKGRELLRSVISATDWVLDPNEKGSVPSHREPQIAYVQKAPARLPAMTPREVCNLPLVRDVSTELKWYLQNHILEIQWDLWPSDIDSVEGVKIHVVHDPYIDGHRVATMAVVFWDGQPVMITQEAGRGGKDFQKDFIVDAPRYKVLVETLSRYLATDVLPVDMDEPLRELTDFYGGDIRER